MKRLYVGVEPAGDNYEKMGEFIFKEIPFGLFLKKDSSHNGWLNFKLVVMNNVKTRKGNFWLSWSPSKRRFAYSTHMKIFLETYGDAEQYMVEVLDSWQHKKGGES